MSAIWEDPANVAAVIRFARGLPAGLALQEIAVTPLCETSRP